MNPTVSRAALLGLFGGIGGIWVSLVGLVGALQTVAAVADVISFGSALPILFAAVVGWRAGVPDKAREIEPTGRQALAAGALHEVLGEPDAHEVPWPVFGQLLVRDIEHGVHVGLRLAYREAPDAVAEPVAE